MSFASEVSRLANPPAPYSIQRCPEPQICQKLVPTIVFWGSNQGGPNLSKICRNFENLSGNCHCSKFRLILDKFGIGTPKNDRRDKFLTNLGFGASLNAVRGRRVRKSAGKSQARNRHPTIRAIETICKRHCWTLETKFWSAKITQAKNVYVFGAVTCWRNDTFVSQSSPHQAMTIECNLRTIAQLMPLIVVAITSQKQIGKEMSGPFLWLDGLGDTLYGLGDS